MNENDGSTARGSDPDTAPRPLEGRPAGEVLQGARTPGPSPEGAANSIDYHPVVPGGHRLARISQCAVERRAFLVGANPTQQLSLQLVATRAVHGGNDMD